MEEVWLLVKVVEWKWYQQIVFAGVAQGVTDERLSN